MNMKRLWQLCPILFACLLTANCATVTRGTTNQVQITSEPSNADVRTSIGHSCKSPCTLTLDRKAEFTVTFQKEGFKDTSVPVATRVAGSGAAGLAGNILLGGVIGVAADAATGASLEHYPNPVHAVLERNVVAPRSNPRAQRQKPAITSRRSGDGMGVMEAPAT